MKRSSVRNRLHANLVDGLILATLILAWIFVALGLLMLRLFGEKRLEAFWGLSKKARFLREKTGLS